MTTTIVSYVRRVVGDKRPVDQLFCLGEAVFKLKEGWKFYPCVSGRAPSRKFHATLEACLPRWLGYPDACESYYTRFEGREVGPSFAAPAPELKDDLTSELLAVLKDVERIATELGAKGYPLNRIRAAIAKAEGRS